MSPHLSLEGIRRNFGSTTVLEAVDLNLEGGKIHALLGENGAGKTTLVRIAAGLLPPTAGRIRVAGRAVSFSTPADARGAGIGLVHQHFTLVEAMTVAENLWLARGGAFPTPARLRRKAEECMQAHAMHLDPAARVADLSVGQRQRLEILKAVDQARRVLLLDEPTASLAPAEIEQLFDHLRALRRDGLALLLITHKLPEVLRVADEVTVLSRGRVVLSTPREGCSEAELARAVMGTAAVPRVRPAIAPPGATGPERLRLQQLRGSGFGPLDLMARGGEIVAIAGVAGHGQRELWETLAGLRPAEAGQRKIAARRVAWISADRQSRGLCLDLSVVENLWLKRDLLCRQFLSRRGMQEFAAERAAAFDIRLPHLGAKARTLSGGNQQKLILARELAEGTELVVADNPTRGLDLGATARVHQSLREAAASGAAVVIFSTDLEEVVALATRVEVAYGGRLHPARLDAHEIGQKMLGLVGTSREPTP